MCDAYNDIARETMGIWKLILKKNIIPSFWFNSESGEKVESRVKSKSDDSLYQALALVYVFQKRYRSLKDKIFGINKELEAGLAKNWADLLEKKVKEELERRGIEQEFFDMKAEEIMRKISQPF